MDKNSCSWCEPIFEKYVLKSSLVDKSFITIHRPGNLFDFDLLCNSINSVDIPTTQKDNWTTPQTLKNRKQCLRNQFLHVQESHC